MSDDVLITPGSRKIEFKDSSANVDAKIETDSSGNLIITNTGGDITIGDTTSDIFVGDGTANVDIVFEQAGEIRGTTGVTVTLGAADSSIRMATDLNLNSNDITNVNDLTVTGNLTITGDINSYNVTDLDVSDKTITLGVGQIESNSGDSGIIIAGSNASLLWDEASDYWETNKGLFVNGEVGTHASFIVNKNNASGDGVVARFENDGVDEATIRFRNNGSGHLDLGIGSSNQFILKVPHDNSVGSSYDLTFDGTKLSVAQIGVTNIVTNKVVKYNGTILDDSNITDTGSLITLGSNTTVSGDVQIGSGGAASIGEAGLNINVTNKPQLLLDGGNDAYPDIVVPTGEVLQIGHWDVSANSATLQMSMETDGDFSFEGNNIQGINNVSATTITSSSHITITGTDKQVKFTGTAGPLGLEFGDTEANPNFRVYYRTTPNTLTFENNGETAKHTFDLSGNYTAAGNITAVEGTFAGNVEPSADSSYSLGTNTVRWANVYADTLYGDGSNITGITATDSTKMPLAGGTFTGGTTYNVSGNAITISSESPQIRLNDTTAGADDFWIHVNSDRFYILADRGDDGSWETPYPLELNASTNIGYIFAQRAFTEAYHPNADKWTTARTLSLTGDVTGSVSWDGSGNASITTAVGNNSHEHSQLYENGTIDFGASYVQWTDQNGTGGTGLDGAAPRNPANGWYHNLIFNHANNGGYYSQIATGLNTSDIYFTRVQNGTAQSWQRIFADDYHPNADKWTTARTLSLTGAVTGSVSWDGSGNASITTTATSDPTLTLSGDASGSATFTNLGNATLSVTVADDSHNHVISNVDGLQTALDAKLTASSTDLDSRYYTETEMQTYFKRGYIESQTANALAVGWYTVATNTGDRAIGDFTLWDVDSSDHQGISFKASHFFGNDNSNDITVLHASRYSGTPIRYIRIKDGGTYDGAALQVYIDQTTNNVGIAITGGNPPISGWDLKDWIPDATDPGDLTSYASFGERVRVDIDQIINGGAITTGNLIVGNPSNVLTDTNIAVYNNHTSDAKHYQIYHGTTRVGEIGARDTTWLRINDDTAKNIYTPRYIRADGGFFVANTSTGLTSSGNLIGIGSIGCTSISHGTATSSNGEYKSDSNFAFLTTGSAAQNVRTKSVFCGTSYNDTPPAGSVNATNTYEINGTTVIDSSRNIVNTPSISNSSSGVNLGHFTGADADQWPYVTWYRDTANGWDEGLIRGSSSRGVFSRAHFGIHFDDDRSFAFHSSGWDTEMEINGDGRIYMKGPVGINTVPTTSSGNLTISASVSGSTAANRGFQVSTSAYGGIHIKGHEGGTSGSADTTPLITFPGNGTSVQGGIYSSQNSSTGTSLGFFTTDSYAAGPQQSLMITDAGDVEIPRGALAIAQAYSSMDVGNLALETNGHVSIRAGNALYFGVTTNNYNSWKTRIYNNNTSTMQINAQGLNVNNIGYGSVTFLTADVNGVTPGTQGFKTTSYNKGGLQVTSSGTGSTGASIGLQQVTSEGDTIIFADYEPHAEWGIYHENGSNLIYVQAGTSTGNLGSYSVTNRTGNTRTAYIKHEFNQSSGTFRAGGQISSNADVVAYASDRRLKENFVKIESAVEKVQKLNGVTFDWNELSRKEGFEPDRPYNDVGLIAQEVQEVCEQAIELAPFDTKVISTPVDPNDKNKGAITKKESISGENYLTVKYDKLVPLLVEAIKEQQETIEKLTSRLNDIEKGE